MMQTFVVTGGTDVVDNLQFYQSYLMTTTSGTISDNKVGIMKTPRFYCHMI